jgi:hypothetical protein
VSGVIPLDDWLKRRARRNEAEGASRALGAAETVGVRALLVHAISQDARSFYERHGFRPSPIDPMTLMITIAEAGAMLRGGAG